MLRTQSIRRSARVIPANERYFAQSIRRDARALPAGERYFACEAWSCADEAPPLECSIAGSRTTGSSVCESLPRAVWKSRAGRMAGERLDGSSERLIFGGPELAPQSW